MTERDRDLTRDRLLQTRKGAIFPLDPDSGATPTSAGPTARISALSPKVYVRIDKQFCS